MKKSKTIFNFERNDITTPQKIHTMPLRCQTAYCTHHRQHQGPLPRIPRRQGHRRVPLASPQESVPPQQARSPPSPSGYSARPVMQQPSPHPPPSDLPESPQETGTTSATDPLPQTFLLHSVHLPPIKAHADHTSRSTAPCVAAVTTRRPCTAARTTACAPLPSLQTSPQSQAAACEHPSSPSPSRSSSSLSSDPSTSGFPPRH